MVQIALKSIPRLLVQDHTTDFQSSTHFADCVQNLSCETGFEEKGFGGKGVWWKGGDSSGRSDLVIRIWWKIRWQMIGKVRRRRPPFNHPLTVSLGAGLLTFFNEENNNPKFALHGQPF